MIDRSSQPWHSWINASVNVKIKTWQLSQAWKGQQHDLTLDEGALREPTHLIKSDFCINVHCQNTEASSSNSVNNTFIIIDMTMYNGACKQEEEWDKIPRTSTVRWNVQKFVQSNVNEAWQWANSQVTNSQQVFHLPDTHRVCTLWVCRVKGHGYVLSARSFKISSCKAHAATEGKDWLATVEFT